MHIIEYDLNGRKASFDADQVFVHQATGDLYLRQSNGALRTLSDPEKAAMGGPASKGDAEMPDLSNLTKAPLADKARDEFGIELDTGRTKPEMLADFETAWRAKFAH